MQELMTLDDVERNIGKWVIYACAENDLSETIPNHGIGKIIGVFEDTRYQVSLDISLYEVAKTTEYEFALYEIKAVIPEDRKMFKLL